MNTLLVEENVISLRTALVLDDGNLVSLELLPPWFDSSIPGRGPSKFSELLEGAALDRAWLYRHKQPASGEEELLLGGDAVERGVRPMAFDKPPVFTLLWSNSGHSVALYLNGEAWAFVDQASQRGYSKGILTPTIGNPWDQELFWKIFHTDVHDE